jgi:hypothetical protein
MFHVILMGQLRSTLRSSTIAEPFYGFAFEHKSGCVSTQAAVVVAVDNAM